MSIKIDTKEVARIMVNDYFISPEEFKLGYGTDGWSDALLDVLEDLYSLESEVAQEIIKLADEVIDIGEEEDEE